MVFWVDEGRQSSGMGMVQANCDDNTDTIAVFVSEVHAVTDREYESSSSHPQTVHWKMA